LNLMWWNRDKKDKEPSKEDAELRALAKSYGEPHAKSSSMSSSPLSTNPSAPQSSPESLPELPMDDVIRGSSITYTRREAKLYAKEEPCDSWRHFDELFAHHLPHHVGSDFYRYGHRRDAAPYWDELRFCIGTKTMTPLEAKIAIGRRRAEKLARLREQGSSEEYWEIRKEPLENPFPLVNNRSKPAGETERFRRNIT